MVTRFNYETPRVLILFVLNHADYSKGDWKMITTEIRDAVYAELLAKSLPKPIRSEGEHARSVEVLSELDEREYFLVPVELFL